jgi:hypothetical protein
VCGCLGARRPPTHPLGLRLVLTPPCLPACLPLSACLPACLSLPACLPLSACLPASLCLPAPPCLPACRAHVPAGDECPAILPLPGRGGKGVERVLLSRRSPAAGRALSSHSAGALPLLSCGRAQAACQGGSWRHGFTLAVAAAPLFFPPHPPCPASAAVGSVCAPAPPTAAAGRPQPLLLTSSAAAARRCAVTSPANGTRPPHCPHAMQNTDE